MAPPQNALVHHQPAVAGHEYSGRAKRGLFRQCFTRCHPALFLPSPVHLEPDRREQWRRRHADRPRLHQRRHGPVKWRVIEHRGRVFHRGHAEFRLAAGQLDNANTSATNAITNGNTLKFIMESNTAIQASLSAIFSWEREFTGPIMASSMCCPNLSPTKLSRTQVGTNEVVSTNSIYTNAVAFESAGMLDNLARRQARLL